MSTEGQDSSSPDIDKIIAEQQAAMAKHYQDQAIKSLDRRISETGSQQTTEIDESQKASHRARLEGTLQATEAKLQHLRNSLANVPPHLITPASNQAVQDLEETRNRLRQVIAELDQPNENLGQSLDSESISQLSESEQQEVRAQLEQLAELEAQTYEHMAKLLAARDLSSHGPLDRPRQALREALIQHRLLPAFMADYDAQQGPANTGQYQEYVDRLKRVEQLFRQTMGVVAREGLAHHPRLTNEELFDLIACIHIDSRREQLAQYTPDNDNKNRVHYQQLDETGKAQRYGGLQPRTLIEFLEQHPNFSRELAVVQSATRRAGEDPFVPANIIPPNVRQEHVDPKEIERVVAELATMNELRKASIAEHESRLGLMEQLVELTQKISDNYPQYKLAVEGKEQAAKRLVQIDQEIEVQEDLLASMTTIERLKERLGLTTTRATRARIAALNADRAAMEVLISRNDRNIHAYKTEAALRENLVKQLGLSEYLANNLGSMIQSLRHEIERERRQLAKEPNT